MNSLLENSGWNAMIQRYQLPTILVTKHNCQLHSINIEMGTKSYEVVFTNHVLINIISYILKLKKY